jgi:tRNA wybutosine-synthesizing protein 1
MNSSKNSKIVEKVGSSLVSRAWENERITTNEGKIKERLPKKVVQTLEKKQYGIYGHSGVQVCGWTKKSLRDQGVCYKQKFYGIECHSCMEFSPAVMWCQENCSFCWRPMEFMKNIEIKPEYVDDVEDIIENLLEKRKKLLSGFNPGHGANEQKLKEAQIPSHFAISLSGEPTMYPKLDKMVEYLKTLPKTKSIFIVTNAQIPEFFEKLQNNPNAQPTQLYISLEAPTKELFDKVNMSLYDDGWERLLRSLSLFSTLSCRRLVRFTQIKGLNDDTNYFKDYKELIELGKPDFVEIKAYMHLGMSQNRHSKEQMPEFVEVVDFGKKLARYLGNYDYIDAAPNSRIVLLRRRDSNYTVHLEKFEH